MFVTELLLNGWNDFDVVLCVYVCVSLGRWGCKREFYMKQIVSPHLPDAIVNLNHSEILSHTHTD